MALPLNAILDISKQSVTVLEHPNLNVTMPYLGKAGLEISDDTETTITTQVMAVIVQSPNVIVTSTLTINLLKTTAVARAWLDQKGRMSAIGDIVVTFNTDNLKEITLKNCAISTTGSQSGAGDSAEIQITIKGGLEVNRELLRGQYG